VPSSPADPADQRSPARRPAPRSRRRLVLAAALGAGWLLLGTVAVVYVGGVLVRLWARMFVLLPRAVVWVFAALQQGVDWWSIAGQAGVALADILAAPEVTAWLVGLELVGAAALYGLQRLFKDEQRGTTSAEVDK
jgi:hypothetical protein